MGIVGFNTVSVLLNLGGTTDTFLFSAAYGQQGSLTAIMQEWGTSHVTFAMQWSRDSQAPH
jgi:hypothetical protein